MNSEQLGLAPNALAAARALQTAHPNVVFTSGRRTVDQQASAMASDIVANRKWISETYVATPQRTQLQAWVDANPSARTQAAIAQGLAAIMSAWTDAEKGAVSKHFSGEAFDVQPVPGPPGEAIVATIKALPGLTKFLTLEGGLVRWHAQFA